MHSKQAFSEIQDPNPLRSAQFHPSGDFLLVAAAHPLVRVYDVATFKAYVTPPPDSSASTSSSSSSSSSTSSASSSTADAFANVAKGQHTDLINFIRYSPAGNMYATASSDGSVKLWDTVTNELIRTISKLHDGAPVASVQFASSGKYLLTSGQDSTCRLVEASSGRCVLKYQGAMQRHIKAVPTFSFTGQHVIAPNEQTNGVVIWDARTAAVVKELPSIHSSYVSYVTASSVEDTFITCGMDDRFKYWGLDKDAF